MVMVVVTISVGDGDGDGDGGDNGDICSGGDYPSNSYVKVCMIQFDADEDNIYVGMKEGLWC